MIVPLLEHKWNIKDEEVDYYLREDDGVQCWVPGIYDWQGVTLARKDDLLL